MTAATYNKGDRVLAFHPRRMGVVQSGEIVTIGPKFAKVDFGPIWGPPVKIVLAHIVEHDSQ